MRYKRLLIALIFIFACVLLWVFENHTLPIKNPSTLDLPKTAQQLKEQLDTEKRALSNGSSQIKASPQIESPVDNRDAAMDRALDEWRTPIDFYGKVIDDSGNPIFGAQVNFSCNDLSSNGTSYYTTTSDKDGYFSINGINGKLLTTHVVKDGYYSSKRDGDSFYYAGQNKNFLPDANNPIVYHLQKKGPGDALVHFHKSFKLLKDGTPIQVDLTTGNLTTSEQNSLKVECWTHDEGKKHSEKYDWKCRLSIIGGGLQSYDEEFPFLAPVENYLVSDEIDMTVKPDVQWQSDVERTYFVHTSGGIFGRITFGMVAGGDHFCIVDAYINLAGSRALEPKTD